MSEIIKPWEEGELPGNVKVGEGTIIKGKWAFKRLTSAREDALVMGSHCTMDGTQFSIGGEGRIVVGDYCYFTNAVLMCEVEIRVGNYVIIGWNTAIADSDFHPIDPAQRILDAMACSPTGKGRVRPEIARGRVVIEDDVWIGAGCTILKGVTIGAGAFIEPGTVITRDVPSRARVMGNPGQVMGEV